MPYTPLQTEGKLKLQRFLAEHKNIDIINKEEKKTYSEVTKSIFMLESFRKVLKEENNRIKKNQKNFLEIINSYKN